MVNMKLYESSAPASSQHELITHHAALVKRIAYHLIARLPHTVDVDDLIQAGMIGLLDASHQYNASQGASFETYAGIRIRGAMLDEIRRNDWAPRSVHRKAREIAQAMQTLEQQLGRPALDMEVAEALGMPIDEYHHHLSDSAGHQLFSLDELTDHHLAESAHLHDNSNEPQEDMSQQRFQQDLASAIEQLPERERLLMSLYYNEELNLKEIGEVLGVSESRVSQIHSQTMIRLRSKLRDWVQ